METDRDLWLWWRHEELHWLSQEKCGSLTLDLDHINHEGLSSFAHLRDAIDSLTIEDCVGDTLSELISDHLPSSGSLTLHIGTSLPGAIQSAPLAWCNFEATPLHSRLCVEYQSPEPYPDVFDVSTKKIRFIDFWQESSIFLDYIKTHSHDYNIDYDRGILRAENTLNHVDLSLYGVLIITAHGTEDLKEKPIIDDRGATWSLPLNKSLPPLIVISACGSECGNLARYSTTLLTQRGVKAVIAPVGKVDATAMVDFIDVFLAAWFQGETVLKALALATLQDTPRVGAARLCLFGNGSLKIDDNFAKIKYSPQFDINRLTLQRYQLIGDFSDTVFQLYRALGLNYDDPHESDQLFRKLHGMREALWPVTTLWLAPYMARLAQQHDHSEINYYQRLVPRDKAYQTTSDALFYYYYAGSEYRQGRYVDAIKSIRRGLQALSTSNVSPYSVSGVKLWGLLVNILVDLNLPDAAHRIGLLIERAFYHSDYVPLKSHETDRFTLLDRQARIAVRQGDLIAAKEKLRRKWQLAKKDHDADGLRELATLALVSAWDGLSPDDPLIRQVRRSIPDIKTFEQSLQQSSGLNSHIYILKGFSAIAWRAGTSTDIDLAAKYAAILKRHYDYLRDSGPVGASIFYCAIMGDALAAETWPAAQQWLVDDGYFFELSVYCALLGETVHVKDYLNRFHTIRNDAAAILVDFPMWDGTLDFTSLVDDVAVQEHNELRILLERDIDPTKIKNHGLIPL